MKNPFSLAGKSILVTGASSGIGCASAKLFSELGAKVLLLGRNDERLEQTLRDLSGDGHRKAAFDLAQTDEIPDFVASLTKEFGPLNGIFHCAGSESIKPAKMLKQKHLDGLFAPTVAATLMLTKALYKPNVLAPGGGSFVVMSSVASVRGQTGMSVYAAAKAAIDGAVRALACELAPLQVRINSLVAGAVETEMHTRITGNLDDAGIAAYRSKHLLGFGNSQDIACGAAYLLSDAARWVTGTALTIDGGYTCK